MFCKRVKIRSYQKGLLFDDREFKRILGAGIHWLFGLSWKLRVDMVSMRDPWLFHEDLDLVIKSSQLGDDAEILELSDNQRCLVWIENRFCAILGPGNHVIWNKFKPLRVETVDTAGVRFKHPEISAILKSPGSSEELVTHRIESGSVGILFLDGKLEEVLEPGLHVFWRKVRDIKVHLVSTRESGLDISGQEILSKDKVSLRLNGLLTYRVVHPERAVTEVEDYLQTLYREAQLALRAVVGIRDLDELLADKDSIADRVREILVKRVESLGIKIVGFGIRDIILPGDMKLLLNRVVESKKEAEANLITRREETAAMRSQANTARILAGNPTLMRLRELELLEKVAASSNLNIVCGDEGISDKVVKLI